MEKEVAWHVSLKLGYMNPGTHMVKKAPYPGSYSVISHFKVLLKL